MFDIRPVGYVTGRLVVVLGITMLFPAMLDIYDDNPNGQAFIYAMFTSIFVGGITAFACRGEKIQGLSIQQTFFLTTSVWVVLPLFSALPFILSDHQISFTDAFFEAMSGLTTTGATVLTGLGEMPRGMLLWRGMMQWFGGVGIIVVAMVFLPVLKVGGMQIFKSESFDTFGKILPKAVEISKSISGIYIFLTLSCVLGYQWAGMTFFDASVHAMTTVATGGFANTDSSFGEMSGQVEYVAVVFMLIASLPFVRYVQLVAGTAQPLLKDSQVRAFFLLVLISTGVLTMSLWLTGTIEGEHGFRKALFNGVSILTGTGYASHDYMQWGSFAITIFFIIGLIGGCAGSATCSIKVFRFQILIAAIKTQIKLLNHPNGVFKTRYENKTVTTEILSSVVAFFILFMVVLVVVTVILGMIGLDTITSVSGAASALANIGPGLGSEIGPAGNYSGMPDAAKWVLSITMLIGRLELMAVMVMFTRAFWRG